MKENDGTPRKDQHSRKANDKDSSPVVSEQPKVPIRSSQSIFSQICSTKKSFNCDLTAVSEEDLCSEVSRDPDYVLEKDIVLAHVEHALFQIMTSSDIHLRSKKLLQALINFLLQDIYDVPEAIHFPSHIIVNAKNRITLLFLFICLITISFFFFMHSSTSSIHMLAPT